MLEVLLMRKPTVILEGKHIPTEMWINPEEFNVNGEKLFY